MGLDIYVKFGEWKQDEDEPEYNYLEKPYGDATYGIVKDSPEVGYLRHNWTSVGFCRDMAAKLNAPYPLDFCGAYEGGNDGEYLADTPEQLARLLAWRGEIIAYLSTKWREQYQKDFAEFRKQMEGFKGSLEDGDRKWSQLTDDYKYFEQCLRNTIGLINFVECNKDKPNLRIEFR